MIYIINSRSLFIDHQRLYDFHWLYSFFFFFVYIFFTYIFLVVFVCFCKFIYFEHISETIIIPKQTYIQNINTHYTYCQGLISKVSSSFELCTNTNFNAFSTKRISLLIASETFSSIFRILKNVFTF